MRAKRTRFENLAEPTLKAGHRVGHFEGMGHCWTTEIVTKGPPAAVDLLDEAIMVLPELIELARDARDELAHWIANVGDGIDPAAAEELVQRLSRLLGE